MGKLWATSQEMGELVRTTLGMQALLGDVKEDAYKMMANEHAELVQQVGEIMKPPSSPPE